MGIPSLLRALTSATTQTHISALAGQRVAVDTYVWLHKGAYSCSEALIHGLPTQAYVEYVLRRVDLLRHFNIDVTLVFDGGALPAKEHTNSARAASRSFSVTPAMAASVIGAIRERGVEGVTCLVAPYEADAQLAWLARNGHVDAVITEDSDLIVYAVPRILYKMDSEGNAQEITLANLSAARGINLHGWDHGMFLHMCILAGCDYLPAPVSIGLVSANKLVRSAKSPHALFQRLICKLSLGPDYISDFIRAKWVFLHQTVWDVDSECLVPLTPFDVAELEQVPENVAPPPLPVSLFAGPMYDNDIAAEVVAGTRSPYFPYEVLHPRDPRPGVTNAVKVEGKVEGGVPRGVVGGADRALYTSSPVLEEALERVILKRRRSASVSASASSTPRAGKEARSRSVASPLARFGSSPDLFRSIEMSAPASPRGGPSKRAKRLDASVAVRTDEGGGDGGGGPPPPSESESDTKAIGTTMGGGGHLDALFAPRKTSAFVYL